VIESVMLLPEGRDFPDINVDNKSAHFLTAGNKGNHRY